MAMTIVSAIPLAYFLAVIAHRLTAGSNYAWPAVALMFVAGVSIIVLAAANGTHQKETNKEHNKVYDTPK